MQIKTTVNSMHLKTLFYSVNWQNLALGILTLMPMLTGFFLLHQSLFLEVALVSIGLFIPFARTNLNIVAMIIQFLLIELCFSLLFFTFSHPIIFIILCSLMAFASIYLTKYGTKLRTLTNFIFIPAVYLACELHQHYHSQPMLSVYKQFMQLTPIALVTVLIIMLGSAWLKRIYDKKNKSAAGAPLFSGKRKLDGLPAKLSLGEIGTGETNWITGAIAIFLAVIVASALVIYIPISEGEWVIWSSAAVITNDLISAKQKIQDRLLGVAVGIPVGFFIAQFLPKTMLIYSLATCAVLLTLVAFKNYRMAFGSRCFFIALASYIATAMPQIALERIGNVILGGIIGLIMLYITHTVRNRSAVRKKVNKI